MKRKELTAISLFTGAGGMDVGFESAGIKIVWSNEYDRDAVETYRANHPGTLVVHNDIRVAKMLLSDFEHDTVSIVFGGPPCQGFSVAGKMDPDDERSTMVWEFLDVIKTVQPQLFVMENVKALGVLGKWKPVRDKILRIAQEIGYSCFYRVLNAANYGVPQNRERVFFIGVRDSVNADYSEEFDRHIESKAQAQLNVRDCLLSLDKAGTSGNPITCTAKISLAAHPIIRKSPYAGMLFNGMGRPMNFNGLANTLPASMGGNKTPIVDERLLYDPHAEDWIVEYHKKLVEGRTEELPTEVPNHLRRLTIKEAAAIQTFPPDYVFCGEKSSIYRQIGNAVPCNLAKAVAEAAIELL